MKSDVKKVRDTQIITEWDMNSGKAAEEVSRKNLAERIETLKAAM